MSTTLLKSIKITKYNIAFKWASNNVFPRTWKYEAMERTDENWQMMKQYLVDRIWMPVRRSPRLYKLFGITNYYDGAPVK